jgi:2'-5' RNA ligase
LKAYICAPLPDSVHKFFPEDRGGDDDSVPHCTVLFVGDIEKEAIPRLREVVSKETRECPPIKCRFGNLRSFPAGDYGVPWCVAIDADPSLEKLHKSLWEKLEAEGIPVQHAWKEYVPHATLKYLPVGIKYTDPVPTGEFVIESIELDLQ